MVFRYKVVLNNHTISFMSFQYKAARKIFERNILDTQFVDVNDFYCYFDFITISMT